MTGACTSLIDFDPSNSAWQNGNETPDGFSFTDKLNFISQVSELWDNHGNLDDPVVEESIKELSVMSVYSICVTEGVGINDLTTVRNIFQNIQNNKNKCDKTTQNNSKFQETVNLFRAFQMLQELRVRDAKPESETKGLLDLDSCVTSVHKCLLSKLPKKTVGGVFSTEVRQTTYDGQLHQYPKFETETEAEDAVWRILDRYNTLFHYVVKPQKDDRRLFLLNFFKCAAWLFYNLLSLHPFGDGNGRLCQLILNNLIQTVTPFPVPLFTERQSYLNAVVATRMSDGKPRDLTGMIIDSVFRCWKKFDQEWRHANHLKYIPISKDDRHTDMNFSDLSNKTKGDKQIQNNSKFQETVNLSRVLQMLQELCVRENKQEPETTGLIDLDLFITSVYRCLLSKLPMKMVGGVQSMEVQQTYDGQLHQYPKFETESDAKDAVWRILDQCNTLLYFVLKPQKDYRFSLTNFIKSAAYLFCELLSLHLFGDGNGRLCQLILNNLIQTVTTLPIPLFAKCQNYFNAVVAPRTLDGKTRDLMSVINDFFSCWKKFYWDRHHSNNLKCLPVSEDNRYTDTNYSCSKVIQKTNVSRQCWTEDKDRLRCQM